MTHAATLAASPAPDALAIRRPDATASIFAVEDRTRVFIRAGSAIGDVAFGSDTEVEIPAGALVPGADFHVRLESGRPVAIRPISPDTAGSVGGFHLAPGGNAPARDGGDDIPAINPFSCWDAGFRPACPDPRGMALVTMPDGSRFWCDIYLLGVEHLTDGTSRCGVTIADGRDTPQKIDGTGRTKKLDYDTAVAIYAHHGKQLLGAEEFFAAALGVTERSAADDDPETTGLDAARTSRFGIMQATGNLWVWGTDGDPDKPRPSLFGGSWLYGSLAGSRFAHLGLWPGDSNGSISARGRCDHLSPA